MSVRRWKSRLPAAAALAMVLSVAGGLSAQSVQIIDASFEPTPATLVSISDSAVTVGDDAESVIDAGELVRIRISADDAASRATGASAFVLILRNGDRLYGDVESLDEEGLDYRLASFGSVRIPLEHLSVLLRTQDEAAHAAEPAPAADELLLMNGDRLSGFASEAQGDEWVFVENDGDESIIDAASIRRLQFADPGVPAPEPDGEWRAELADGSVVTAEELEFSHGRFAITYAGRSITTALEGVRWLEPARGAIVWLTDLPVSRNEQTPYFGGEAINHPAQPNPPEAAELAVVGKGLLVRSRSTYEVEVPEGARAFRTAFRVPRDQTLANVDLRIRLDDEVAWEQSDVTAQTSAKPVEIEVGDARQLTLEVDYGHGLDVQDQLLWLDPAFLIE